MSRDIAVRVEGLGKKYLIGHEAGRERYTALRDVIGRTAKNLVRTTTDILRGRAIVMGCAARVWSLRQASHFRCASSRLMNQYVQAYGSEFAVE